MTVFEGTIFTAAAIGETVRFLVEDDGKVVYAGDILPEAYETAPRTMLGDGAMIPALADSHIHFMSHALFASGLDVRSAPDIETIKNQTREFAAQRKDKVILGFGLSAYAVAEQRLLTREELDAATGDRPAYIVKYDGHAAIANSALIAELPKHFAALRGYDAVSGLMQQEAYFAPIDRITARIPLVAVLRNMLAAADGLAARGVGIIHSVTGVGFPMDMDVTLESVFARGLREDIAYRVFFQTMETAKAVKRRLPRIGGCFAAALDGCFGSVDAALNAPYRNGADNRGILFYDDDQVAAFAKAANRAGLQIQMHAIGDAAFDQATRAIAAALGDFSRPDHRHTIIHACLPTERGLELCARHGIILAVQPAFLDWKQEPLEYLESILGDRLNGLSPFKTMMKSGITLTGGSDAPCTVPDPLAAIAAACNHYLPEERLSFGEALSLFTKNAAFGCFDEAERGSLEPGKRADFVILNADPLQTPTGALAGLRAEKLYLGGKPYESGQGLADLLARSLSRSLLGRTPKI